jgi:mRNA-degrading endonuclease RelE of RelBE toxin-antitoxin system
MWIFLQIFIKSGRRKELKKLDGRIRSEVKKGQFKIPVTPHCPQKSLDKATPGNGNGIQMLCIA